jgi:hypothetical protein
MQCPVSAAQWHRIPAQVRAHSRLSGGPALLLLLSDNALRLGQECDGRSQASAPIVRGWRSHSVPTCIDFSQIEACSPAVDALAIELAKAMSTEPSAGFSTKVPALKASPRPSMSVAL